MKIELDYIVTSQPETTAVYYRGSNTKAPDDVYNRFMAEYLTGGLSETAFRIIIQETGQTFNGRTMTIDEYNILLDYAHKQTYAISSALLNKN